MNNLYFDYAGATPLSNDVLLAMQPYFQQKFYNPSAVYLSAQAVHQDVENSRGTVAKILGAKTTEIIFTAGGTESDNLAINGVMSKFKNANCVVSAIEHDAVLNPAKQYDYKIAPVNADGRVDLEKLANLIDENTVLVSVMYANNEIGSIQPIAKIAKLISQKLIERKKNGNELPLYLHSDACQATNYLPLLVNTLGVDLLTINGGKIYGPKQSGALFIRTGVQLSPQILGGGQEKGFRSGTENVPSIIGFTEALEQTTKILKQEAERLRGLQDELISELKVKLPKCQINGSIKHRLPNNVHVTFLGQDNERLMMELDELGVIVATGSACSASSDEPSHVLRAIGLSDEEARSSLRITFGRDTDQESIKKLLDSLVSLVAS